MNIRYLVFGFAGAAACAGIFGAILLATFPTMGSSSVGLILGKQTNQRLDNFGNPIEEEYAMGLKIIKAGWASGHKSGDIGWYKVDREAFEAVDTNAIVESRIDGDGELEILSVLVRDNELQKDCLPGGELELEPTC